MGTVELIFKLSFESKNSSWFWKKMEVVKIILILVR